MSEDLHPEGSAWPIGGGETAARVRTFDWAATPLGPIERWPQSLKSAVDLVLSSHLAMNLVWGPERVQIYNQANQAFMGTKHPDAFGRPAREHWAEIWDAAESIHRRVFAGETVTLENHPWTLGRNGRAEETFFTSYFTPIRDETGAVAGELVTAFETTEEVKATRERRRVEQALRKSEARLRDVLDGIADAFYALDHDLRFLYASRKALKIWGKAAEDLIGQPLLEAFPHLTGTLGYAAHERVLETGEAKHFELLSPLIGRWFEVDISPSAAGLSVAFRDIHRRKRAETALRESEGRLQAAVDLVGLALYSSDPLTNALEWDARVKAMWGLPPEAHVDYETVLAAVHPEDRARVEAAIARCADPQGDGIYDIEYRVIGLGDGIERWVATRGQTSFDQGTPVGFHGIALDVTERKRADEALRHSEARLAAILEQLPVGVGLFDCDGRLRQSNSVLRRYIAGDRIPSRDPGATTRWRAFQDDGSLLPSSDYPGARALRGETLLPGIDFLHTSGAGQETWVRASATPFRDENGTITGAVMVVQDLDQQKRADQLNLLLIAELRHRTRNLLAVVEAISEETLGSSRSLEDFGTAFHSRLATLARVQDLLIRGEADAVTIGELVRLELRALGAEPDGRRISVVGPEVALPHKAVQILALAVHELATNARKHGALRAPEGRLAVSWQVMGVDGDRRLALEWHESGAAARRKKAAPNRKGFGRTLIEESLPYQLDAETRLEFGQNELRCSIIVTLASRGAEATHGRS